MEKSKDEYVAYQKVVVFGCSKSGKSALTRALSGYNFDSSYSPTNNVIQPNKISCFVKGKVNQKFQLNVLEVRITNSSLNEDLINNLLFQCQCALFLVDLNSQDTLYPIQNLIQLNIKTWKTAFPYLKLIIVGTKMDLKRKVLKEEIESIVIIDPDIIQSIDISFLQYSNSKDNLIKIIYKAITDPKNHIPLSFVSFNPNLTNTNLMTILDIFFLGDSCNTEKIQFINWHFETSYLFKDLSTVGILDEIETIKIGDKKIKLKVYDTPGQERYRSLPRGYWNKADVVFIFFSYDSQDSFYTITRWMNDISQNKNKELVLCLIGNKCEIEKKEVTRQEALNLAKEYKMDYYEISTQCNINIDEVFADVILKWYSKSFGIKEFHSLLDKKYTNANFNKCAK